MLIVNITIYIHFYNTFLTIKSLKLTSKINMLLTIINFISKNKY